MADYRERVAERIARTRELQGMSKEALAYKAGVSVKQLGRIEAGKSEPRLSTVRKLADALDTTVAELRPDLEAEEQALQDHLERIEAKLDQLLARTITDDDLEHIAAGAAKIIDEEAAALEAEDRSASQPTESTAG